MLRCRSSPALHRAQASATPTFGNLPSCEAADPLRGDFIQVSSLLRYRRVVDNLIGKRAPPGE